MDGSNARPEYPRPQLTRPDWKNLNGVWQWAEAKAGDAPPIGRDLGERILVPYPVESALSGIQRHVTEMYYRRTVTVPAAWRAKRVVLHFGAVDYTTSVWVNGTKVVDAHRGGYDAFSADVTDALTASGPQEIVVGVEDLGDATFQPVGKQRNVPDRASSTRPARASGRPCGWSPSPPRTSTGCSRRRTCATTR